MSSTRRLSSFRLFTQFRRVPEDTSYTDHVWPLDASDLAVVHNDRARLAEVGGVRGVAAALRSSVSDGLFEDEVESGDLSRRERLFGRNVYPRPPLRSFWSHCWEALHDPMLIILIVGGAGLIGIGVAEDPHEGWYEGVAIYLAVIAVTLVGAINNLQQERAFRELEDDQDEETFKVTRGGQFVRLPQSDIVTGDLVTLSAGDAIPADGILVVGDDLAANESKMTGESDDIPKNARAPFLLGGTEVRKGQLEMMVVGVGVNSAYGRIMSALASSPGQTPLQKKLERVATIIGYIGGGVALVLFLVMTAFWISDVSGDDDKSFRGEAGDLLDFFILAVTVVVVAVPEGLPLAVTISLAYSMKKMVKDQNLVRVLAACETMGNCTTICSDKTGTLTQNVMSVRDGWIEGSRQERVYDAPALSPATMALLAEGVVVNSKAEREIDPQSGREVWTGSQTEIALMRWLEEGYGVNITDTRARHVVRKNYPFDSAKKNSSVILRRHGAEGGYRRYYKGAAEMILERCERVVGEGGAEQDAAGPLGQSARAAIADMTGTGLRTIAFAYQDYAHIDADPADPGLLVDPKDSPPMVFFGCVGIKDPLRPEARRSVRRSQEAGVVVRMVTGDHIDTARFIAREAGIVTSDEHHVCMTGDEFRSLLTHPAEAAQVIPRLRVLARSRPEDKKALVEWLQAHGDVVAVTGDGTNDAPALKSADVGIAMNIVGTAVAKQAAEILILDDNFASIVRAIMWGRSVFDNIRKFVQFQLTVNMVALTVTLLAAVSNTGIPLTAVQLLWVNMIMDTMAALALGTEVPTEALLRRRPYTRDAPLISNIMWRNIAGQSVFQIGVLCFVLFAGADYWDVEEDVHFTMVFNTFVFLQIFNEINSRKVNNDMNVFEDFFTNNIFLGVMGITCFFQVLMVEVFGSFADTAPLTAGQWLSCVILGALSLPVGVLIRLYKMDETVGMVEIPPETFAGATLGGPDSDDDVSGVDPEDVPVVSG